jgi:hypothetical protein
VSDAVSTQGEVPQSWYARAIAGDPAQRERFAEQLEAARNFQGEADDLNEIEALLTSE